MQRRLALIALTAVGTAFIASALAVMLPFALGPTSPAHAAEAFSSLASNVFILGADPSPTATAQPTSGGGGGLDPAVVAAIITAVVALVAALIAGGIAVFQTLYAARVQRESAAKQEHHDQEMERLRRELDEQYKRKEQEEQRKVDAQEATRREMLLAQNNEARAKAYRRALHADPRISRLQILEMTRPLEVTNVYVRVRVHEEARLRYDVDPLLDAAEQQRDPNALLRAGRTYLERRVSSAIDPDAAIGKYKRCAIVGDPGAGKTTLLKFLTLRAADNALKDLPDLPIHVELSAFASSEQQDLLDFAATVWDERYAFLKTDARAYMDEMLKAGKAWLLLDALDEAVIGEKPELAEASYQRVSEAIMRTATRYPDAPIVVTARKAGYQQRSPLIGFTELEVVDFRLEDIEQFVTKWFACYADPQKDANAAELKSKLARHPRIQALAANPLLLSLIVLVYEAQLDLPDRRAELYKHCVEILLTKWDATRNIRRRREFKPEHKRQLLAELAWHFHQQGRRYMPEPELLAQIAHFLPAVNLPVEQNGRVLAEIANENGLLKEQAHGWYGFLHLTLQEYFVAQYASDHNELTALLTHLGDPWWEEVLLLYAGQVPDASPLFEQLLGTATTASVPDDVFHTNLLTAGRCLAASPVLRLVSFRETTAKHLFDLLTPTPYFLTRQQAAEVLTEIGGTVVISRLLRLPADEQVNQRVRRSIAGALGTLGERSVIPDLLRLLADEQVNSDVRQSIARALGTLGEHSVIPNLVRLLADKQVNEYVRGDIATALGTLGERSVIPDLLRLLTDEQVDAWVRWSIARALGTLEEPAVIPDLLRLLVDKQVDEYLRRRIAEALGMLRERSVIPDLLHLLADKQVDGNVRQGIARALGTLEEPAVIPDLLRLLVDKQVDEYLRRRIAEALGMLRERSVIPDLLRLLADKQMSENVRGDIAEALGMLGERSVIPDLLRLLADKQVNEYVRWSIARALGTLGERSVISDLLRLLADEQVSKLVRMSIAASIEQLANDEPTVYSLAAILLQEGDIADDVYRALWTVSRRVGVRVFIKDGAKGKEVELVRW